MKPYEKALLDAFVWSQAVEETVRDLVADFFPRNSVVSAIPLFGT